jgi:hypothetical protein
MIRSLLVLLGVAIQRSSGFFNHLEYLFNNFWVQGLATMKRNSHPETPLTVDPMAPFLPQLLESRIKQRAFGFGCSPPWLLRH